MRSSSDEISLNISIRTEHKEYVKAIVKYKFYYNIKDISLFEEEIEIAILSALPTTINSTKIPPENFPKLCQHSTYLHFLHQGVHLGLDIGYHTAELFFFFHM